MPLVQYGDPVLGMNTTEIEHFDAELQQRAQSMLDAMVANNGCGLAGPQVGFARSMFVFWVPEELENPFVWRIDEEGSWGVVVNPAYSVTNMATETMMEGCLSSPGIRMPIARATGLRLIGKTVLGAPAEAEVTGWLARIVQHECDHLLGKCIADRLNRDQRRKLARRR